MEWMASVTGKVRKKKDRKGEKEEARKGLNTNTPSTRADGPIRLDAERSSLATHSFWYARILGPGPHSLGRRSAAPGHIHSVFDYITRLKPHFFLNFF